ncbi:MAG TPA: rod shape-determining protein MreC [candidate division Zixibacteria bacterium]|nr:rod shape-determining protein MreC [candidate division Zixibacteria bacterium]
MNLISNLSHKNWRVIHLILVVLLATALIIGRVQVAPLVSELIGGSFFLPFFKLRTYVTELANVNIERERLSLELAETSEQLAFYQEIAHENERIREMLGFEPPPGYRLLQAKVVSVTGSDIPVSALVNRGILDSVEVNLPVISREGLVGRVEDVTPDHCLVQLLTDPRNRVATRVASSREMGIVRYLPSEGMLLTNFPNQGEIAVGDTVVSSGLGGVYPPGLMVGYVTEVTRPENRPDAEISLQPAANFHSIEQLFILLPEAGR